MTKFFFFIYEGHPISSDNELISKKLFCNQNSIAHCMWPWLLPNHFYNLEFLSHPDLMLYKFVDNKAKVHGQEKSHFN